MIALVLVSHSAKVAEGAQEVALAMAPQVPILLAAGTGDGGLGTSFDRVEEAAGEALRAAEGEGVVFLTDLGSANLTVATYLEFSGNPSNQVLAEGPIVEGAVSAAVASQLGQPLEAVAQAVRESCQGGPQAKDMSADYSAQATVADPAGLHARPAAQLARLAAEYDALVLIDGVQASSAMEIMALGVDHADKVTVKAVGPDAQVAVEKIVATIEGDHDQ